MTAHGYRFGLLALVLLSTSAVSAQVHVQGSATVNVSAQPPAQAVVAPRAPDPILVGRTGAASAEVTATQVRPSGHLVRATEAPGTGVGVNVGASLGGGLSLSDDSNAAARSGRGRFFFGLSAGLPMGLVFEPHAVGYFSIGGSGVPSASGEPGTLTTSALMGGVRLKLDPWINLHIDADAGWAFNEITFSGGEATRNIDNGGVAHFGLGYRFFTNCEQEDSAVELGLHAQLGLGDNRVNDAIFATVGFQLDVLGERRFSFTGSCRRQIAARLEAEARAEYERLHPPVIVDAPVPSEPVEAPVPVSQPAARVEVSAPAVEEEVEVRGPPLRWGLEFRPYAMLGSSLGSEGSIGAPAVRGGGGLGLGLVTSPWFDIRADWDYVGQNTLEVGSAGLHSFTLVNRLRLDPIAPFYFDFGAGYSVASSAPVDDVQSGFVGRLGAGYRFIVGCGNGGPLAFELGAEARMGIGSNRIADGLFFTLGAPITFGDSFANESSTCVAWNEDVEARRTAAAEIVVEPAAEPEVPSGPPSVGWFIRGHAFVGSSLSAQGSISAPELRAGYGIGVGIIPGPWFDARLELDATEQGGAQVSATVGTVSLVGRLRMDNVAPLYADFGVGYGFAGSTPVDDVTSGLVGRAGFGYRYVAGCNEGASLAFDIGVEGRVGIGDNRIADGVYLMAAIPISGSRTYATESAQCRWRAESNAREAEEERRLAAERERARIAEERRVRLELEAEAQRRGVTVEFILEERRLAEIERARIEAERQAREQAEQAERDRRAREAWNAIGGAVNTANNVAHGGTVQVNVSGSAQVQGGGTGLLRADGYAFVDARGTMTLHPEVVPLSQLQAAASVRIVVFGTEQEARAALSALDSYLRANRVSISGAEIRVQGPGPVRIEFEVH